MAISQPRKSSPCSHSADKITQMNTCSVRDRGFRNTLLTLSVQRANLWQMQCSTHSGYSCLKWFFFLTWQDTHEQITPLTALVPSDSFSSYLDLLSHLLLSATVVGCCCRCLFLPLLLSDKPIYFCLQCCRCQLTKVTLPFSLCRWKMHWVRQIFSLSWTCTLLIANNSKCRFQPQLVTQGFVQLENYFDEVRVL